MSAPISAKQPMQKVIALAGLFEIASSRSKLAVLPMIRSSPQSGESGGSSGCMARRTPAASAAGTTALRKRSRLSHIRSHGIGVSLCGMVAAVTSARRKPLVRAPPRVVASKPRADHHRVLAHLRHEIVGDHLDAELAEMADDPLVALGLFGRAVLAHDDAVDRRAGLGDLQRQAEARVVVARSPGAASRSSGRSCMS